MIVPSQVPGGFSKLDAVQKNIEYPLPAHWLPPLAVLYSLCSMYEFDQLSRGERLRKGRIRSQGKYPFLCARFVQIERYHRNAGIRVPGPYLLQYVRPATVRQVHIQRCPVVYVLCKQGKRLTACLRPVDLSARRFSQKAR